MRKDSCFFFNVLYIHVEGRPNIVDKLVLHVRSDLALEPSMCPFLLKLSDRIIKLLF